MATSTLMKKTKADLVSIILRKDDKEKEQSEQIEHLCQELDNVKSNLNSADKDIKKKSEDINRINALLTASQESYKKNLSKLQFELDATKKQSDKLSNEILTYQRSEKKLIEEIADAKSRITAVEEERATTNKQLNIANNELADTKKELAVVNCQINDFKDEIDEMTSERQEIKNLVMFWRSIAIVEGIVLVLALLLAIFG